MSELRVQRLIYRLEHPDSISFSRAPEVRLETETFEGVLVERRLVLTMKACCPNVGEARRIVEPYLEAWEVEAALQGAGRREITFAFFESELVDRDPSGSGNSAHHILQVHSTVHHHHAKTVELQVSRSLYPAPPTSFRMTPEVRTLWLRYKAYSEGRELLQSMAYFCLTELERIHGGRKSAAKILNIAPAVLGRVGLLSSSRGRPATARKAPKPGGGYVPLSRGEETWLEKITLRLIHRAGEVGNTETSPLGS